tara:strand:+ start:4083 stop:4634 length:552 start_codon:yes stop_codon:yes gene_type:complete
MEMKTFAFSFGKEPKILALPTKREALNFGNGLVLAQHPVDLEQSKISLLEMLGLYNSVAKSAQPIKSFRDRKTAAEKLMALAEAKAETVNCSAKETKVENSASATVEKQTANRKGRSSSFKGKLISISPSLEKNPRREGTNGYKSIEIVINARNGITYEEFIDQGGRRKDLAWDLAHGFVIIE